MNSFFKGVAASIRRFVDPSVDLDMAVQKRASLYARSLIEASLDPFVMISPDGKITDVNEGSVKVTGVAREALIGTDFSDYFTEPDRARAGYQHIFAFGSLTDYPLTIRHVNGKLTEVLYNAAVYKDASGKVKSVFASARDVTVQKKAEALLEEKSRQLARSNVDLEQFAYVISHDLKAPLRAVDQLSYWIKEDLKDSLQGRSKDQMELLRNRVRRMEKMLDDLLNFARVESHKEKIAYIDTIALISEIIASLAPPDGFKVEAAPDLPVFMGEKVPLQQVLRNLIDNALKHHDQAQGRIVISSKDLGGRWQFTVDDDGPGIPAEYHDRVFKIFQTLQSRDEKEGSGMGLTLIKKILELQDCVITIEPKEGRGTRFCFTWPKKVDPKEDKKP